MLTGYTVELGTLGARHEHHRAESCAGGGVQILNVLDNARSIDSLSFSSSRPLF